MLETIEKLLVLQDRDRKLHRVQAELGHINPERETLRARATTTQAQLEAAKTRVKQIESERKRLELDVEAKKSQIEKYANQQLQTRKNEEYRALAHEIETCKSDITKIDCCGVARATAAGRPVYQERPSRPRARTGGCA